MSWRLWKEDEAFLRRFLREFLGVEPKEIVIFDDKGREKYEAKDLAAWLEEETNTIFIQSAKKNGYALYLRDVMHEAVHLWKPKWSEDHADEAAGYLASIFEVYEKEERKSFERLIVSEDEIGAYLDQGWELMKESS